MNNTITAVILFLEKIRNGELKYFNSHIFFLLIFLNLFALYLSMQFSNGIMLIINIIFLYILLARNFIIFVLIYIIKTIVYFFQNIKKISNIIVSIIIIIISFCMLFLISIFFSIRVIEHFQITDPIKNSCFLPLFVFVLLALVFMVLLAFTFHLIFWKWCKFPEPVYIFEQFILTFFCGITLTVFTGILKQISKYVELILYDFIGGNRIEELQYFCSLSIEDAILIFGFGIFGMFLSFQITSKYSHAAITKKSSE